MAVLLKIGEAPVGGVPVLRKADVLLDVATVFLVVELLDPSFVRASLDFEDRVCGVPRRAVRECHPCCKDRIGKPTRFTDDPPVLSSESVCEV